MATQLVAGRINSDGSIAGGSGFYVRALGDGVFIVEFDSPLPNVPAVVVKENYRSWGDFDYTGGDSRDNVVLVAVDQKGFKVITGNNSGARVDRNFAFLAAAAAPQNIGPPLVWGNVSANGTLFSGSGIRGARGIGDGVYEVDFEAVFQQLHSVVVTQNYPDWSDFSSPGGDVRDNAVIVAADERELKYITGDNAGSKVDRNCSFIAAGSRAGAAGSRLMFGNVDASGTIRNAGSGDFTIVKEPGDGTYTIQFNTGFGAVPAMMVTQQYRDWSDFRYSSGNTLDNAVIVAIDRTHARLITGGAGGGRMDRNFSFLIAG